MIVLESEIIKYLGKDLASLRGRVSSRVLEKIRKYSPANNLPPSTTSSSNLQGIDYLFLQHHEGNKSITQLAANVGISEWALRRVFDLLGLPRLNHKEALERIVAMQVGALGADPITGERYSIKGGKIAAQLKIGAHDINPETGEIYQVDGGKASLEKRVGIHSIEPQTGIAYSALAGRIGGPKTAKMGLGLHNPAKRNEYLRTYHGYRSDIGFNARSMWEANLARLLMHLGFYVEAHVPVILHIGEKEREIFKVDTTDFIIDLRAISPRGNSYYYEIMAHPHEGPKGTQKIRLFKEQYPDKRLVVITPSSYRALEDIFREPINKSDILIGWETIQDNARSNPQKYITP